MMTILCFFLLIIILSHQLSTSYTWYLVGFFCMRMYFVERIQLRENSERTGSVQIVPGKLTEFYEF